MPIGITKAETQVDNESTTPGAEGHFVQADGTVKMESNLRLDGKKVVELADPVDPQDSATKAYVDDQIVSSSPAQVKASANDTTAGYLEGKLAAGSNVAFVVVDEGGDEVIRIDATGGGGGGITAPGRDYLLSLDGSVPEQGVAYLFNGDVSTLISPIVVNAASTFTGASIKPDSADPSNDFALEFLVNGFVQESLALPALATDSYTESFSWPLVAGDEISVRLRRTAGATKSAFRSVTVAFELDGTGTGGGPGSSAITALAGETLALGEIVALDSSGSVYLSDATTATGRWVPFGIAKSAYSAASTAQIDTIEGALFRALFDTVPPAASNGTFVYMSPDPGKATLIPPQTGGNVIVELGILRGADGITQTPEILWRPRVLVEIS